MHPAFCITNIYHKFELIISAEDFYRIKLPDPPSKSIKLEDRKFSDFGEYFVHVIKDTAHGWKLLKQFRLAAMKLNMDSTMFQLCRKGDAVLIIITVENYKLWYDKVKGQKEIFKNIENVIMESVFELDPENLNQYRCQFNVFYLKKLCFEFNRRVNYFKIFNEECFYVKDNYITIDKNKYETLKGRYAKIKSISKHLKRKANSLELEKILFSWDPSQEKYIYVPSLLADVKLLEYRFNRAAEKLNLDSQIVHFSATLSYIYIDCIEYFWYTNAILEVIKEKNNTLTQDMVNKKRNRSLDNAFEMGIFSKKKTHDSSTEHCLTTEFLLK